MRRDDSGFSGWAVNSVTGICKRKAQGDVLTDQRGEGIVTTERAVMQPLAREYRQHWRVGEVRTETSQTECSFANTLTLRS